MGIILLNKKPGITSFDSLRDIKRALGTGKAGHTGTLDKFAQGLLIVLAGRSLKLTPWFLNCDKKYIGQIYFGKETDTLDPEGSLIHEAPLPLREDVERTIPMFTGKILQAPPAYSAIHIDGRRASDLARSGNAPKMKERAVCIHKLELLSWEPPFAEIFVHCSSGTYIRSLARDIALAAGSRAHLAALVRTHVAGFSLEDAKSEGAADFLRSVDKSVISALGLPWFEVTPPEAEKIICGKPLAPLLETKECFYEPLREPAGTASGTLAYSLAGPLANTPEVFSAAVFCGETLTAIVEKTGGKWKYGCVLESNTR